MDIRVKNNLLVKISEVLLQPLGREGMGVGLLSALLSVTFMQNTVICLLILTFCTFCIKYSI